MGFRSSVLFRCLESDVGHYLTAYQLEEISAGRLKDIWPDASASQVACMMLLQSFDKKLVDEISDDAEQRALEKFLQVNEACRDWQLEYHDSWDEVLFGTLKQVLWEFFNPSSRLPGVQARVQRYPLIGSYEDILDGARLGPGASLKARGGDFYTKLFSSPLTCTRSSLYETYRRHLQKYLDWEMGEIFRSTLLGNFEVVPGNRVSFVPKSNEISRTICTEPTLNMFYQLGLEQILLKRLYTFFGIDLANQQFRNRELALLGSRTGLWSTIDLSSASDSISLEMLKKVMPADQLDYFLRLRSPESILPTGESVALHMISTMGNGYTFALQTILFSAIVMAAFRCREIPFLRSWNDITSKNWGVNGDDIVVPTVVTSDVLRLLRLLGFKVNASKTFVEGPFRESCGGDFFKGHPVRGVYLKSLDTTPSRYVAINLLNSWSARTGISLSNTVQYLLSTVKYLPVPPWENADAGIRTPLSQVNGVYRSLNWSYAYQRLVPVSVKISIEERRPKELVRAWRRSAPARICGYPIGERRRLYNPWGLYISFLQGCIVDGSISVRQDRVRYRAERAVAPNWERRPPDFILHYSEGVRNPKGWERPEDDVMKLDTIAFHDAVWLNHNG